MIPCQRHLFDIPEDVAYLNCAYMSPLMKSVDEAGSMGLARKMHAWEITPDQFFSGAEEFRTTALPRAALPLFLPRVMASRPLRAICL